MSTPSPQRRYLEDELFQLTLGAVVQRGKVYEPRLSETERRSLHGPLRTALGELSAAYDRPVSDEAHVNNIMALADRISRLCGSVLANERFRVGSAQKALNLHLKYRWCLEWCAEPPHCPFDALVLAHIPSWLGPSWTALDSVDEYRRLVTAARACAAPASLSMWELTLYNAVASALSPSARA
jgi:hypothetical protein